MLQLKSILENKEYIIDRLKIKNFDATETIQKIIDLDLKRRKTQNEADNIQSELNKIAKEIGQLIRQNFIDKAEAAKEQTDLLKSKVRELIKLQKHIEDEITQLLLTLPNTPHISVPKGETAEDNEIVRVGGPKAEPNNGIPHWELSKRYDIIDFELGNKITGAGFPVYKGKGAKLQRALISFFLDKAIESGFKEVIPPYVVNEASAFGTGQLPDKEGLMYHLTDENFYLVPTAEVPVTNILRDVIVNESELPIKYTAYTPCFRREAGSYGKDVRGLNRLHQFDKVEIVVIEHPNKSYEQLEKMVRYIENLILLLNLPYRIVKLCGGDMSFTSALTYDFEVYSMAQQRWLEVSSVSNFESFQANRLKLRYKDQKTKKNYLCHTLNGSALALPRIIAALLENNQFDEGIKIPEILIPYTGFDIIN